MKKLPPYGRQLAVPKQTKIVMLYIGAPYCWQAAKQDQEAGQINHLVLPNIFDVNQYKWPLDDCHVVAIDFGSSEQAGIEKLICTLAEVNVAAVSVRQMNINQIIVYVREEQGAII